MKFLNETLYATGFVLYVLAQAQNSIRSSSNGLQSGWAGVKAYLKAQAVNLGTRAFFSALAFEFLVKSLDTKVQAAGYAISSHAIAGIAGYASNALLYQFIGLFPGLRVEIPEVSPPATAAPAPAVPPSGKTS